MKNLKEFKASGENSSTADPIDTGDTSLPTGKRKGEGQDPMPTIPGGGTPGSDLITDNPVAQAPTRRGDKRNSEAMPKLKGMREVLNIMATMSEEQVAELVSALADEEDVEDEEVKVAALVREDFDAIFGSTDLSEEAQAKMFAIFEGAVLTKVTEEKARLEAEYQTRIDEELEELTSELEDRLNTYMDYVAKTWAEENQIAIDRGIRNDFSESFIEGLKNLFAEHYVEVPEGKDDVIGALADKVEELADRLDEAVDENVRVMSIIREKAREEALIEQLSGLTDVQKEKLVTLAEGIEFASVDEYEAKVKILKENFLANKVSEANPARDLNEEFDDGTDKTATHVNANMRGYIEALKASER